MIKVSRGLAGPNDRRGLKPPNWNALSMENHSRRQNASLGTRDCKPACLHHL